MRTREQIYSDLRENESIKSELDSELSELNELDNKKLMEKYQDLVGQCFKHPNIGSFYRIESVDTLLGSDRIVCSVTICGLHFMSLNSLNHSIYNALSRNSKITVEEFELKMTQTFCNMLRKNVTKN